MNLKALVFDAYGTLFDVHSVVARCEQFWPGRGAALSQTWRSKQLEYSWLRALMGRYLPFSRVTREALAYASEALGLALDASQSETLMQDYRQLDPYPDVPGALEQLRAGGRRLAILTNGSPDMIDPLLRHCKMDKTFDAVLSADAIKTYKIAPPVYQLAVDRLGVPASQIGFVSSNCWDALGAKNFGFRVWWINRLGAPLDRLDAQPDGVLEGLGELPRRLAA